MSKDRKIRPVSFSLVSEYDVRLLQYSQDPARGNFSQYVKRLIDADMSKASQPAEVVAAAPARPAPVILEDDRDAMSGFL